jgi:hypothetical protein
MIYRYLFALLLLSPLGAFAQLRVELSFEQETYLPYEEMDAVVRIYNSSGQTLVLGRDDSWLTFDIEPVSGGAVRQKKRVDVRGEFTLPNLSHATKRVNLAEAYDLTRFGRYIVSASVRVAEWGEVFSTPKPKPVGIATGVTVWESTFGVPPQKAGDRPEVRKYQVVQANHLKRLSFYIRITDESGGETFKLFPIGGVVGVTRPEPQLDRWSNLHLFYQDGARSFRYFVVTPDGLLLTRQVWEISDSRPSLTVNSEGRISVTGGVRRVTASDLPPPEPLSEASQINATSPAQDAQRADAEKREK